ncbi:Crp/Fnr family transcriptional regulator [Amycolatopsis sp. NBC_00355]|uniref:Crp/Fnr family transcriptional regulator n=1 Tax=Amycolatopsis sp. NBC_00355 TaxID=2975957 RepID=UPI002E25D93F
MTPGIAEGSRWPPTSLLGRLSPPARELLLSAGKAKVFAARSVLIRHGDIGDYVLLLRDGAVKVAVDADDGDEILLGVRVAGDLVGEIAAFDGQHRSATVTACGEVHAKLITRVELEDFFEQVPDARDEIARMIVSRLRWSDRRRIDFLASSPPERLSRLLVEIAEAYGRRRDDGSWELGVHLTQAELGSFAGMARRTTEKQFATLRRAGLVEVGYREITLLDMAELKRLTRTI